MKKMRAVGFVNGEMVYKEVEVKTVKEVDDVYSHIISLPQHIPKKGRYVRPAYKVATDAMISQWEKGIEWKMCHGLVFMTKHGRLRWYIHAWLEKDGQVWDVHRKIKCSKREYERKWKAKDCVFSYNYANTRKMMARKRTYGPWHEDLRDFLKGGLEGYN